MSRPYSDAIYAVRQEIAARAARLIAEDGLDYASAKRKAIRQIAGAQKLQGDFLPDNEEITEEVRLYQQLFQADSQPGYLATLRETAVALMRMLAEYHPYVTGAVLNGTANKHSDIHLHLYTDSAKDVEIFLINQGIDFEVAETPAEHARGMVETLSFMWSPNARGRVPAEGVHLHLHDRNALRSSSIDRADLAALEQLIDLSEPNEKSL